MVCRNSKTGFELRKLRKLETKLFFFGFDGDFEKKVRISSKSPSNFDSCHKFASFDGFLFSVLIVVRECQTHKKYKKLHKIHEIIEN